MFQITALGRRVEETSTLWTQNCCNATDFNSIKIMTL